MIESLEPVTKRRYFAQYAAGDDLIIALHGWGQRVGERPGLGWRLGGRLFGINFDFLDDSRLLDFASSKNASIVFPVGINWSWDQFHIDIEDNPDMEYVSRVVESVQNRHGPFKHVYLYGFSQGATFAHIVLDWMPDIEGAVFHSGPGPKSQAISYPMFRRLERMALSPELNLHALTAPAGKKVAVVWGQKDPFVRWVGDWVEREIARLYKDLGCDVLVKPVEGLKHNWWKDGNEQIWRHLKGAASA